MGCGASTAAGGVVSPPTTQTPHAKTALAAQSGDPGKALVTCEGNHSHASPPSGGTDTGQQQQQQKQQQQTEADRQEHHHKQQSPSKPDAPRNHSRKALPKGAMNPPAANSQPPAGREVVSDRAIGGGTYSGEMCLGVQEGRGTFFYPNGDWYDGEWLSGYRHGRGTWKTPKGVEYEGEWDNDRKQGLGRQTWPDGRWYQGQWKAGVQHGTGTYTFPDGATYRGDYSQGKREGAGVWRFANGDLFEGGFSEDKPCGKGMLTERGVTYEVEYDGAVLFSQGAVPTRKIAMQEGDQDLRGGGGGGGVGAGVCARPMSAERVRPMSAARGRPMSAERVRPMSAARGRPMSAERVRPMSAERGRGVSRGGPPAVAENNIFSLDNDDGDKGGQMWDVFINYRVDADADLVEKLYDKLCNLERPNGKGRLRVFWDKKCLVPGLGWEEGFVSAVCSCRVAVLVMSRKTFVNQPKYDVTQLTSESRGDNVILEYELVLELFDAGRIKAVLPVLVGDLKNDADMGGEVYTHFFSSGCLPALPDVKIPSIQAKALSYIRSEPGLEDELSQDTLRVADVPAGTPSLLAGRTVKQTVSACLSFQGHFICGPKSNSIEDAVTKVWQTNDMFDM